MLSPRSLPELWGCTRECCPRPISRGLEFNLIPAPGIIFHNNPASREYGRYEEKKVPPSGVPPDRGAFYVPFSKKQCADWGAREGKELEVMESMKVHSLGVYVRSRPGFQALFWLINQLTTAAVAGSGGR